MNRSSVPLGTRAFGGVKGFGYGPRDPAVILGADPRYLQNVMADDPKAKAKRTRNVLIGLAVLVTGIYLVRG